MFQNIEKPPPTANRFVDDALADSDSPKALTINGSMRDDQDHSKIPWMVAPELSYRQTTNVVVTGMTLKHDDPDKAFSDI